MKSLVIIGWGDSYESSQLYRDGLLKYRIEPWKEKKWWKNHLAQSYSIAGWLVFFPKMPSSDNAQYEEWKIVFQKILISLPSIQDTVFVGHSLGACFLLSIISEWKIPFTELHLVAWCIWAGSFLIPESMEYINSVSQKNIHIWHSEDDTIVSFKDALIIYSKIPWAIPHFFNDKSHFQAIEVFNELETILLW